jgi:Rod binding domain-containing protein
VTTAGPLAIGSPVTPDAVSVAGAFRPGADGPVTEQFEALLLGQLLKGLRKTIPASDERDAAREMYQDLHDEMLAVHLARQGGIGLGAILRAYLDQAQRTGTTK